MTATERHIEQEDEKYTKRARERERKLIEKQQADIYFYIFERERDGEKMEEEQDK